MYCDLIIDIIIFYGALKHLYQSIGIWNTFLFGTGNFKIEGSIWMWSCGMYIYLCISMEIWFWQIEVNVRAWQPMFNRNTYKLTCCRNNCTIFSWPSAAASIKGVNPLIGSLLKESYMNEAKTVFFYLQRITYLKKNNTIKQYTFLYMYTFSSSLNCQ